MFTKEVIIGFNLAFDWFHICQQGTTLLELKKRVGGDKRPLDYIDEYALAEKEGRDGPCYKPAGALDLMLVAKKGKYQSTMDRKPIRIKRVPNELAQPVVDLLDKTIKIPNIYFAGKKQRNKSEWTITVDDKDFSNIELKFRPSTRLKDLAAEILGYDQTKYGEIEIDRKFQPIDVGYAPYALALSSKERNWRVKMRKKGQIVQGQAWPGVIRYHVEHWAYFAPARKYASDDIVLTKLLYDHLGFPPASDKDSILSCMVGAVRWRGYAINIDGIRELREKAKAKSRSAPRSPGDVYKYIVPLLSDAEKDRLRTASGKVSTKKVILQDMTTWKQPCLHCISQVSVMDMLNKVDTKRECDYCNGTGNLQEDHPVAVRAKACLEARLATKEVELYDKLLLADRFHASFNVLGALSARMSGADGLNAQGINHAKYVRKMFPLAHGKLVLTGGDFSAFEVSIADAICNDPKLRDALRTCEKCKGLWPLDIFAYQVKCPHCGQTDNEGKPCRQKFHGVFGMALTGGTKTYDEILATKGQNPDLYDQGKRGGFSQFYGGNWNTLVIRLGVSEEIARAAEEYFLTEYTGVGNWRAGIKDDFCSMRQEGGLGTKVEWHEPKEYVESLTGHRRYFTMETMIAKSLFQLSTKIPDNWKAITKVVTRTMHKGPQKLFGAVMSALIACAFNVQASVMRAAANHVIQSTGAELTKMLQVSLWDLQPVGINEWHIQPMNIHDEIMCPCLPHHLEDIKVIVDKFVRKYSTLVPLLAIDWSYKMDTWAEK